jgi:hypothetical protein
MSVPIARLRLIRDAQRLCGRIGLRPTTADLKKLTPDQLQTVIDTAKNINARSTK